VDRWTPCGGRRTCRAAGFGSWKFTHASVKSGSTLGVISTFPDDDVIMENSSNQVLAFPSALSTTGNSFKAVWRQAA
jgi:hypothetical protein